MNTCSNRERNQGGKRDLGHYHRGGYMHEGQQKKKNGCHQKLNVYERPKSNDARKNNVRNDNGEICYRRSRRTLVTNLSD